MMNAALTVWFTLATLLGPGTCCCSLAASFVSPVVPPAADQAPRPVKPCCEHRSAATDGAKLDRGSHPAPHHGHAPKPGKCPCESEKRVTTLPPKGLTAAQADQLLSLDFLLTADLFAPGSPATASVQFAPERSTFPLAGRDLLAAYSVLRC